MDVKNTGPLYTCVMYLCCLIHTSSRLAAAVCHTHLVAANLRNVTALKYRWTHPIQPNHQNKCWQYTFQQTTDMMKLFYFFMLHLNFFQVQFSIFCCNNDVIIVCSQKKHLVRPWKIYLFGLKRPGFVTTNMVNKCTNISQNIQFSIYQCLVLLPQ